MLLEQRGFYGGNYPSKILALSAKSATISSVSAVFNYHTAFEFFVSSPAVFIFGGSRSVLVFPVSTFPAPLQVEWLLLGKKGL